MSLGRQPTCQVPGALFVAEIEVVEFRPFLFEPTNQRLNRPYCGSGLQPRSPLPKVVVFRRCALQRARLAPWVE